MYKNIKFLPVVVMYTVIVVVVVGWITGDTSHFPQVSATDVPVKEVELAILSLEVGNMEDDLVKLVSLGATITHDSDFKLVEVAPTV